MRLKLTEKWILWGMILLYIAVFGSVAALRHYNFYTQTWDLAAFVQSFWSATQGHGLTNSLEQVENHLGVHWSPFLFLLVPFYFFFRSPYALLFLQTAALAIGALPVFYFAKQKLPSPWPFAVAAAYLLYPGLQWTNLYDFHEISFFVPLFLSSIYFMEARRWGWAGFFLALSAAVKEDAIIAVAFAGIYLLFAFRSSAAPVKIGIRHESRIKSWIKNKPFGVFVIILALVYFLLAVKVFMPAVGGGVLRFDRYANLGENPAAIVKNVAANPVLLANALFDGRKISYLFWLFLPIAFLPFFQWRAWLLLIPGLAENLLTDYHFQFSGLYHYDAILIPGVFIGAIHGLNNLMRLSFPRGQESGNNSGFRVKPGMAKVLLAVAASVFIIRSPLGAVHFPVDYFQHSPVKEAYRHLVRLVPDDPGVSVAALTNLVPHLSHRKQINALGREPGLADLVLADLADQFGFKDAGEFQSYLDGYLKSGLYKAQLFEDRYLVIIHNKFKFE